MICKRAFVMRFFDVGVYRDDVLTVLHDLDDVITPLQTLCNSPRESEDNDEALNMALNTRGFIANILDVPESTDDFEQQSSSAPRS